MRPLQAYALAVALAACTGPIVGPSIPGGGSKPLEPTFTSIDELVLTPRCSSSACHGGTGNAPLDLSPGQGWTSLVNAPSTQTEEMPLVTPQDVSQSYLVLKLRGTYASTGFGASMPPDGEVLSDEELAAIEAWISNGAPND